MDWPTSSPSRSTSGSAINRRAFIELAGVGGGVLAAAGFSRAGASAAEVEPDPGVMFRHEGIVLFQGDSITDAGRSRERAGLANDQAALGNGYAWLAAAALLVDRPGSGLKIYNRGISGNKVFQLAERWQADCLDLKPDVLSILIGVNDFWHTLNGSYDGTIEVYERDYTELLARTREALPGVKLVVCEPFVLRCGAVNDQWFPAFDRYREASRRVAEAAGARFVPFQSAFDEAVHYAPPEHWAKDGVHPSPAGAALMAHVWQRAVTAAP